jgi:5-methylcytosine-specific restriction endonuclease McrA
MDRVELEAFITLGLSLQEIGRIYQKDHSTIGYWLKKHGLRSAHHDRFAPRGALDRDHLAALVDRGLTTTQIAAATARSTSTVRYWLDRHGLRTVRARQPYPAGPKPRRASRWCLTHGEADFILERSGYYRCTRCRADRVADRRRKVKATLVDEAGGRCALCGYSRYAGALHFHHVEPAAKSFAIARAGVTRSLARARAEAAKCVLLCANCHAEIEAGVANLCDRQVE